MMDAYKKLSDISLEHFYKDPAIGIEAAEKGYALAKRNRNQKQIAHFLQRLINLHRERGNLQKLKDLNAELRVYYQKLNNYPGLATCCNHDSFISIQEGKLDQSIEQIHRGFELLKKEPNGQIDSVLYTTLGLIEMLQGNVAGALKALYSGFQTATKLQPSHSESEKVWILSTNANRESNLGICYMLAGNTIRGKEHLLNAKNTYAALENTTSHLYTLANLGQFEREDGNYEAALPYLEEAIGYAKKNNAIPRIIDISCEIAQCYLYLNKYDEGWKYLSEAIKLSKECSILDRVVAIALAKFHLHNKAFQATYDTLLPFTTGEQITIGSKEEIYQLLSETCAELCRWEEAFNFQKLYQETITAKYDQKKLWAAAELEIEFENRNKKKEFELLEQHAKQQSEDLATQALQLLKHREFLDEIKQKLSTGKVAAADIVKNINTELNRNDEWVEFELRLQQSNGKKMKALKEAYPALTATEVKVCALLTAELSTKAISSVLSMSPRTVEWHRAKVRKKMKVKPSEDLIDFLRTIN